MPPAITITAAGGPDMLKPEQRPVPQPDPGRVLIKVAYAGINRHDRSRRKRGFGPKGATDIPGLEVSGEIIRLRTQVESICIPIPER